MSYIRVGWLLNLPINPNFSMEDDTDSNGLSDNLTDVSGTHSRTEEGLRFHVQSTNGEIYLEQEIDNTKNYRIYFDYKGGANIQIKRYDNAGQLVDIWKNEDLSSIIWNYKLYSYNASAEVVKLRIYFACESGDTLYLDNLAIIENEINILINPTTFNYDLVSRGETIENIDNQIQFIEPYKNKVMIENLSPVWGLITYNQKAELDKLIDKKILIRTHDRQIWTAIIIRISFDYKSYDKELDQKYGVNIELVFY